MAPVRLALVDDSSIVIEGLRAMLEPFADRVDLSYVDAGSTPDEEVDVTLYDPFLHPRGSVETLEELLVAPWAGHVVIYSWDLAEGVVEAGVAKGCAGYVDKSAEPEDLVLAVERVARGRFGVREPGTAEDEPEPGHHTRWLGMEHLLSARESEIVTMIAQGMTNQQIAESAYLSINTVKSYIRAAYQKMDVSTRAQAVRWGIEHGMLHGEPDGHEPDTRIGTVTVAPASPGHGPQDHDLHGNGHPAP